MNKIFAVGIPTVNRADLLVPTLLKYYNDFPNTFFVIIDNGCQEIPVNRNTTILRCGSNIGVSASWNAMAQHVFYKHEIPNIIVSNDDIYWGRTEKQVIGFIDDNPPKDFIVSTKEWCNFLLNRDTFQMVGAFDEHFKCYFEDNDYDYRMRLQQLTVEKSPFFNPELFRNSMSLEKDPALKQYYQISREYYKRKWGGYPGNEIFTTPFDIKHKKEPAI